MVEEAMDREDMQALKDALLDARTLASRMQHESEHGESARDLAIIVRYVEDAILRLKSVGHDGRWKE